MVNTRPARHSLLKSVRTCSFECLEPRQMLSATGLTTTQGDAAQLSDIIRERFGLDGAGVKIGVISNSYDRATLLSQPSEAEVDVANGDLPGVSNPNGFSTPVSVVHDSLGGDEGRAMLQIIHDVAPAAELFFHSGLGTTGMTTAINALVSEGVDIIVDDLTVGAPFFQDSSAAQAVESAVTSGVVYVSSAGNEGRRSYESTFVPGPVLDFNGRMETVHLFDATAGDYRQSITIPEGGVISLTLGWDSVFPVFNKLNMYLYEGGEVVAQSVGFDGLSSARDLLSFTNESISNTEFDLVITLESGVTPGLIKYYDSATSSLFPELAAVFNEYHTNSSTIFGHANAEGAITVGAADYRDTPAFGTDPPIIQSFSSAGGTPILFDTSGGLLAEPIVRMKPDIVGPDNGNTTFFGEEFFGLSPEIDALLDPEGDGFPNFAGTSAAAPHIAGLAALLLQANPTLSPEDVRQALTSTAIDMDDPSTAGFDVGFDFGTGHGFVDGLAALTSVLPPKVLDVTVSSSDPLVFHDPFVFSTVDGAGTQIRTVPVGKADTVAVTFSEAVSILEGDLQFVGVTTANVPVLDPLTPFTPPTLANGFTATWQFDAPVTVGDHYSLSLNSATIIDLDGNLLDGEWTNPSTILTVDPLVSKFPSGDGQEGGDFNFVVTLFPGDANGDLAINNDDFNIVINNFFLSVDTFGEGDFNGNGTVDNDDFSLVINNFFTGLGPLELLGDLDNDGDVDGDDQTLWDDYDLTNNLAGDLDGDGDVDTDDFDLLFAQIGLELITLV